MKFFPRLVLYSAMVFIMSTILNFGAFVINYRILAFPYLSEEQRVENADQILTATLLSFSVASLLTAAMVYLLVIVVVRSNKKA